MSLTVLATAAAVGIVIASWQWLTPGTNNIAVPAPSSSASAATPSHTSIPPAPSNPATSQDSSPGSSPTPPSSTAAIPPSVEQGRDFADAADAAMAQLGDLAERIRMDVTAGADVRPLLSQATSVVGSLRGVNPPDSEVARWQAQLSLVDSSLAAVTDQVMRGDRAMLQTAVDELTRQVGTASTWVQSLRR